MNDITKDNEIDLIEIFQILWEGKLKIIAITFLTTLIGIIYIFNQQDSFKVFIPVKSNKPSAFLKFTPVNDILSENELNFQIDAENIFNRFELIMTDYEEIKSILISNKLIQQRIKDLDESSKEEVILDYAKAFKLDNDDRQNLIKEQIHRSVSFQWHDTNEGIEIVTDVLLHTLERLKMSIIKDINQLAEVIDYKKQRQIDELNIEMSQIQKNEAELIEKRIIYLLEQSEIAKALGIETNTLDANALSQSEMNNLSFSIDFETAPSYLRGYKAIYKEIELLKNRSQEEKLLMADGYLEAKAAIRRIETRLASSHLINALKAFENSNAIDLINLNLSLIKSETQNQKMLIFLISLLLGGVISAMYILAAHVIRNYRKPIEKVKQISL